MTDGFFHATPIPGTCCGGTTRSTSWIRAWWASWAQDPELLMLMLMSFWQEDVAFMSDVF